MNAPTTLRLDQLLLERELVASRTRAQRLIRDGHVFLLDAQGHRQKVLTRPGEKLSVACLLDVETHDEDRYVSRAGLKLEGLLSATGLSVDGMTLLDVGQSTGGFTDCALTQGAACVIGIEVGHHQLHARLRDDARVHCLEGVNARALPLDRLEALAPQGLDGAMMDVSFISQTLILPGLAECLPSGGWLMSLVKPQFELTRADINDKGLVRDPALYTQVEARLRACCDEVGFEITHWLPSPLQGGDGNHEFLMLARRC